MMDRDRRVETAAALREFADTINGEQESGPAADVDAAANLRDMADELEAEPAGYDYEWAAAERGEALRDLIYNVREQAAGRPHRVPRATARAEEVMEGVKPSPIVRERDEAREALRMVLDAIDVAGLTKASALGRQLLEGVERTHTLVPNTALEQVRRMLFFYPPSNDSRDAERVRRAPEYAHALEAASRGEHVEWPA